ncbi:MAG: crossover junction endodeoxyribonuclease RuvC [Desulfobacterales bacterium]
MLKVIGIDPGLAATGVAVLQGNGLTVKSFSYGTIKTSPQISLPLRST